MRRTLNGLRGTAINNMGVSYFMFGSLDSALTMFRSAEDVYETNGNHERTADALNNQSQVYGVMGNHQEQRRCLFTALGVYRTSNDKKNEGTALNNIGNYYGERGLPDSS
ncbi:MAG: tetratricopeptide repeat protein [Flavobacteriales bacterium]|nr:tetratricopeptide repeat protein [Flavobacteriales bacterium]